MVLFLGPVLMLCMYLTSGPVLMYVTSGPVLFYLTSGPIRMLYYTSGPVLTHLTCGPVPMYLTSGLFLCCTFPVVLFLCRGTLLVVLFLCTYVTSGRTLTRMYLTSGIILMLYRTSSPVLTVDVTETCRFLNRRTAVVRLNRSLENIIRTLTAYM